MIASAGIAVRGVDVSTRVVDEVNRGASHFEEAGLDDLVRGVVESRRLIASTTPEPADIFVICVPTPAVEAAGGNKVCDLSYVLSATRSIAPHLRPGNLVILESTSPIGASERVRDVLADLRPDLSFPSYGGDAADVSIAYCPERIIPGQMIKELVENDRIVGGLTDTCALRASALYRLFVKGNIHITRSRIAEAVKLTENSFRDVNIAFANELSMVCDKIGIDTFDVIKLANCHPRVNILTPGPGVGGHCIPVDPWFLWEAAPDRAPLLRTARHVNDGKVHFVVEQVLSRHRETGGRVALLGLTYKADVDDFRESPAFEIAEALHARLGDAMVAIDPYVGMLAHGRRKPGFAATDDLGAVAEADIVVALVGHSRFKALRFTHRQHLLDVCGLYR
jgi:UDP-N-acetyl-D-mannosaminuronic acid dehydrogenase